MITFHVRFHVSLIYSSRDPLKDFDLLVLLFVLCRFKLRILPFLPFCVIFGIIHRFMPNHEKRKDLHLFKLGPLGEFSVCVTLVLA